MRAIALFTVAAGMLESAASSRLPAAGDKAGLDQLIQEVKKLGGTVEWDQKAPGGPALVINLGNSGVADEDLSRLMELKDLRSLVLSGTGVTDVGLEHLRGCTRLHDLHLGRTRVTGAGLKALAGLSELRYLDVSRSGLVLMIGGLLVAVADMFASVVPAGRPLEPSEPPSTDIRPALRP